MRNKLRCAVIGVGNMGKNHVRTYLELEEIQLVAVADTNTALAQENVRGSRVTAYSDYTEMISEVKPNAVSICVPTALHYQIAKYCLEKKIHVLLEKPIAETMKEGKGLLSIAKSHKCVFLIGHIERFNPSIIKVKELIDKGDLGNITAIIARRVGGFPPQIKDANIAIDLAIHDIDIVNYLLDDLPVTISVNKQKNHIEQREDSVEFFLKYKKASAYIQANWITPVKIRKLNITGTEGYLEMDYITQQIEFQKSNYKKFRETNGDFSDYVLRFSEPDRITISVAKREPLREEILYFLGMVERRQPIDSRFAIEALKTALHS
ncbi:MAG: Gfo/Idh/MocA family oxidoreductase [Candidatus Kerfeldbacteria bacterium]|nr:Gfo/Idh/MocA family oxidoreductase [Candidatus Kerfeldbacteria bacterium]